MSALAAPAPPTSVTVAERMAPKARWALAITSVAAFMVTLDNLVVTTAIPAGAGPAFTSDLFVARNATDESILALAGARFAACRGGRVRASRRDRLVLTR